MYGRCLNLKDRSFKIRVGWRVIVNRKHFEEVVADFRSQPTDNPWPHDFETKEEKVSGKKEKSKRQGHSRKKERNELFVEREREKGKPSKRERMEENERVEIEHKM